MIDKLLFRMAYTRFSESKSRIKKRSFERNEGKRKSGIRIYTMLYPGVDNIYGKHFYEA